MIRFIFSLPAVLSLIAMSACTCQGDPDRPPVVEEGEQRFLLCGRLADDRQEEILDAGPVKLKRRGFVLERLGEADGKARFGVISGVEEWNEPNRANLQSLTRWFKTQEVEAIIVIGGIGPDRETCLNVLKALASSEVLIMPLIGASADFAGYRRAIAQVRQEHENVIDLTTARLVRWDGVDLVTLPGYHNPFYLSHRRGGCAYRADDVSALDELLDDTNQPVLLVSTSPPRGHGSGSVDRARGDINIGDPQLTELIRRADGKVAFGLFGHVYEAGGNATADVEGRRGVRPERWSKTLYLNPGAAEAVPYDVGGGGRSRGMGAVVEIGPQGALYRVKRLKRLPASGQEPQNREQQQQPQEENDAGAGLESPHD